MRLILSLTATLTLGCAAQRVTDPPPAPIRLAPPAEDGVSVQRVDLGRGLVVDATSDITSKGNGTLNILNQSLFIYDAHDEGDVYEHGRLNVAFTDLDDDGYRDMVITGVVLYTYETGDDVIADREAVTWVYTYEPDANGFALRYTNASFDLADGPEREPYD